MFPNDRYYTLRHQWVKSEGEGRVRLGLTAYAEHKAGTATFFRFPEKGRVVELEEELCVMETVKGAFSIVSPLSGRVSAINTKLDGNPTLFHIDPFSAWLVELEPKNSHDLKRLLSVQAYEEILKEEL